MGIEDNLSKAILDAQQKGIEFERFQSLSSSLWKDLKDLAEIKSQEDAGKPINIKRAREIVANVDEFNSIMKSMPGMKLAGKLGGMKKIIEGAHKHLEELEEKVKTQGEYIEPIKKGQDEPM